MEGLTLKSWTLGEKIGTGACSDVYAVTPATGGSSSTGAARFVMKVSQVPVLPAAAKKNKKRKKTPAERNADALYAEYLVYQACLRDHARVPSLPDGAYGEDKVQGYRFLVLERLGRTLETVLREEGAIPSATAARLGLEILDTLQHLHVNNLVYVDVKPENFLVDADAENKVYCVDFGISERYVMATGKHKDAKVGAVVGTPTFLSLNCHSGATPSRRDDIEALLHVLIYLQLGSLPWQSAASDADGAKLKKATSVEQLCKPLPAEWGLMLREIRACGFEDKPAYEFFAKQLTTLGGTLGSTAPFDWGSKSSKPALKVNAAADAAVTPSASPASKRTKKERAPAKSAPAAARKPSAATKSRKKQESDDDADSESDAEPEVVREVARDPHRRRKAAHRAVGASAAAAAAARQAESTSTRSLRSSSSRPSA